MSIFKLVKGPQDNLCPAGDEYTYISSGLGDLQTLLHMWCLEFNPVKFREFQISDEMIDYLTKNVNTGPTYKSRDGFNKNRGDHITTDILKLQNFPYNVVSASYGCNHDFYDTKCAANCWNTLNAHHYEGINDSISVLFEQGINTTTTSTLDSIWEKAQENIDNRLIFYGCSFPTVSINITRTKLDTTNADQVDDLKTKAKQADGTNILQFLSDNNIRQQRLAWAIDTYQSWLDNISSNKLNLGSTIAIIDGASTTLNGNIPIVDNEDYKKLSIGPYIFGLSGNATYPIDIKKLVNGEEQQVAACAGGASVTTIINKISEYGTVSPNAARSNIGSKFDIQWHVILSSDEMILILELIKAAGDQAPIDICSKIISVQDPSDERIFILSTGDLLAHKLAVSKGIPSFCITSTKILISIPMSMIETNIAKPTLHNFIYLVLQCDMMLSSLKYFKDVFGSESILFQKLLNFSPGGRIMTLQFSKKMVNFFNKITYNVEIINKAIDLFRGGFFSNNPAGLADCYFYLVNNLNSIDFSPNELYDFLFASKNDTTVGYQYDRESKEFIKITYDPDEYLNSSERKKVKFCDNREHQKNNPGGDCLKDGVLIKETPVEYVTKQCVQQGWPAVPIESIDREVVQQIKYIYDPKQKSLQYNHPTMDVDKFNILSECIKEYIGVKGVLKTDIDDMPEVTPKNQIFKDLFVDDGNLHEGYLLAGLVCEITYEKNANGQPQLSEQTNLPIQKITLLNTIVPLDVLENTIQSTLIDMLWEIPYNAFIISGDTDIARINELSHRVIYILKTIHIGLNGLGVLNDDAELSNYIIYIFLGLKTCKYSEKDDVINTEGRQRRGKFVMVGFDNITGAQYISQFIDNCCTYINLNSLISHIINANSNESFFQLLQARQNFISQSALADYGLIYITLSTEYYRQVVEVKKKITTNTLAQLLKNKSNIEAFQREIAASIKFVGGKSHKTKKYRKNKIRKNKQKTKMRLFYNKNKKTSKKNKRPARKTHRRRN
jgi:hypothetical protein